jgi:hypothetical protein
LGPGVEFAEAKEVMDNYFVLDLAHDLLMDLKPAMSSAFVSTQTQLASDFKPGTEEYEKKSVLLRGIQDLPMLDVPTALNPDPAAIVLEWVNEAKDVLKTHFDCDVDLPTQTLAELRLVSKASESRPIVVTDELLALAKNE